MTLKKWAQAVKARDNGHCVICGELGVNAHHILACSYFPEKQYDVENGVTLCRKCHVWAHRGSFSNPSKYKYSAQYAVEKLMERATSSAKRPMIEKIVYAQEAVMLEADKYSIMRDSGLFFNNDRNSTTNI